MVVPCVLWAAIVMPVNGRAQNMPQGDAARGKAFFQINCAVCHSPVLGPDNLTYRKLKSRLGVRLGAFISKVARFGSCHRSVAQVARTRPYGYPGPRANREVARLLVFTQHNLNTTMSSQTPSAVTTSHTV